MTYVKLPKKLAKEPLIDVVFEVRFVSTVPGSNILPGLLFTELGNVEGIESFPVAQLPSMARDSDPHLRYAPLSRLNWQGFNILVGDRTLGIACKMPYPGWSKFKEAIRTVLEALKNATFITEIERYSIKYVDFFDVGTDIKRGVDQFNLALSVGTHALSAENLQIRIEIPKDHFLHAVQVLTNATIPDVAGQLRTGAILDVDSFFSQEPLSVQALLENLEERIDAIHLANKQMFFDCLSKQGLANLEPVYE